MYLKEIRAKGFKSFADQTIIELDNGLTGIVGPNGSGKSNVVDAIRWVLGEQSVKSLRGAGSMTDVIFSGSKSRKNASSATVTLVFDNSDRYLKIDTDTVYIKRQLFGTGESDYFINNNNCRLADITELLIDTGVGRESFNIISQGAVDEIINTKADERRNIFEEAAGVLKYKKRKNKALRQLDTTNKNLTRVNDIILELEENLVPLKEQAEIATNYKNLKEELHNLEIALNAHDITKLNNDIIENNQEINVIRDELSKINVDSLSEENTLLTDKNKLQTITNKWRDLNSALVEDTKELEKLRAEKQLVIERTKYRKGSTDVNQILDLKEKKLQLGNRLKMLTNDLTNLNHDAHSIKADLEKKQTELDATNIDLNALIKEYQVKEGALNTAKQRCINLKATIDEGLNLNHSVKHILRNKKLTGIHNIVGKLLTTEEKYQHVINTSLGATAQFIIVNDEAAAKTAINYLRINELGRATFLPLSATKPRLMGAEYLNKVVSDEGFIDIAINLIKFKPEYNDVYSNLLGTTVVAKTLDDATRISNKLHRKFKVVTLDGDLVNIGGSMTGGRYKTTRGVISETFELVAEEEKVITLTTEYEEIKNTLINKQNIVKKIRAELDLLNEKTIRYNHLIEFKKQTLEGVSNEHTDISNQITTLSAIVDHSLTELEEKLVNDYYELEAKVNTTKADISKLNLEIESMTSDINELEHKIKKDHSSFNELNNKLKTAEIAVNRYEVKIDFLLNYLNEEYSITYEKAKAEYPLTTDPSEAKISVNKLKHAIKKLGEVNLGSIEEFERINTRYEFLTSQKADLEKAKSDIFGIIDDMDAVMIDNFTKTFNKINVEFNKVYKQLFGGGEAHLTMTDPEDILNTGIEISALPPGKKLMHISLLSGGEKTFTAIALLFAILNTKPVPFCVLDEVEAALDEANVVKFCEYLRSYNKKTQFLVITHKKKTMEYVDKLYGITMREAGVSKLVSVKLSK